MTLVKGNSGLVFDVPEDVAEALLRDPEAGVEVVEAKASKPAKKAAAKPSEA